MQPSQTRQLQTAAWQELDQVLRFIAARAMNSCQMAGKTHTSILHMTDAAFWHCLKIPHFFQWNGSQVPGAKICLSAQWLSSYLARLRSPFFPLFFFFLNTSNTSLLQLMARRIEAAPRHTPFSAANSLPSSVSGPVRSSLLQWCALPHCGPWWWPLTVAQHWLLLHSHPAHHHAHSQSAWAQWREGCSWQSSTPLWSFLGPPAPSVPAAGHATVS